MARRVAFALIVAAASACAPRARPPARPAPMPVLEFAGASIVARPAAGDPLRPARFGGISGIAFDSATGELLGISDDSVDSRVFIFTVSKPDEPFSVPAGGDDNFNAIERTAFLRFRVRPR